MKKLFSLLILLIINSLNAQSFDPTFGTNGVVKTNFTNNFGLSSADMIYDTYLYPDGKILAVGSTDRNFGLAKYNADGTLDVSFNPTGVGFVPPGTAKTVVSASYYDEIYSVAIHSDGKIITCGYVANSINDDDKWLAMVRYTANGLLDPTFGQNGIVKYKVNFPTAWSHNTIGKKIYIDNDKYLVVGYVYATTAPTNSYSAEIFLARFNLDGTIDNSFGTNGVIRTNIDGAAYAIVNAVTKQADGKIVVVGSWQSSSSSSNPIFNLVVRYNADGTLDSGFGTNGIVKHQFGGGGQSTVKDEEGTAVAIQNDGKIVVSGNVKYTNNKGDFFAIRYNADGSIDNSFGAKGFIFIDIDDATDADKVNSMAILSDGKILLAGATTNFNFPVDYAIARLNANGTLDVKMKIDFGSTSDVASSILVQPDGKIVVSGYTIVGFFYDFLLVRFTPELTAVDENNPNIKPENFYLSQNYPNPFNPSTTINFSLPISGFVTLKVYDALGNEIATLVNENLNSGSYSLNFDASKLTSGVYFYKLTTQNYNEVKKMILIK